MLKDPDSLAKEFESSPSIGFNYSLSLAQLGVVTTIVHELRGGHGLDGLGLRVF